MELKSIIRNFENTLDGKPWYGRPVYALLREVDPVFVFTRPSENTHSQIEILYHMLTWAEFALARIRNDDTQDLPYFEK
jgi:hypothetical protein